MTVSKFWTDGGASAWFRLVLIVSAIGVAAGSTVSSQNGLVDAVHGLRTSVDDLGKEVHDNAKETRGVNEHMRVYEKETDGRLDRLERQHDGRPPA